MLQSELTQQRITIAQMVHDDVCGNLTALLHDMHWIVQHSNQPVIQERAKISLDTVKSALDFSQQLMSQLHPADLEQGLTQAIAALLTRFSHRCGIQARCSLAPGLNGLPEALRLLIYRTFQEALSACRCRRLHPKNHGTRRAHQSHSTADVWAQVLDGEHR